MTEKELSEIDSKADEKYKIYVRNAFLNTHTLIIIGIFIASALVLSGIAQLFRLVFFKPENQVIPPFFIGTASTLFSGFAALGIDSLRKNRYDMGIENFTLNDLNKYDKKFKKITWLGLLFFLPSIFFFLLMFPESTSFTRTSYIHTMVFVMTRYLPISAMFSYGIQLMYSNPFSNRDCDVCPSCKRLTRQTLISSRYLGSEKKSRTRISGFQLPKDHTIANVKDEQTGSNYRLYTTEHAHFTYKTEEYEEKHYDKVYQCTLCGHREHRFRWKLKQ